MQIQSGVTLIIKVKMADGTFRRYRCTYDDYHVAQKRGRRWLRRLAERVNGFVQRPFRIHRNIIESQVTWETDIANLTPVTRRALELRAMSKADVLELASQYYQVPMDGAHKNKAIRMILDIERPILEYQRPGQ